MIKIVLITAAVIFLTAAGYAVTPNEVSDFQDGTNQNWTSGPLNVTQPVVLSGGFGGAADKFLRATSTGALTSGGKLVILNITQWSGNYIAANIVSINVRVRNSGASLLKLRIGFNGGSGTGAGTFVSTNPIALPTDNTWRLVSFPIMASDLTGTANYSSVLSSIIQIRILHNSTPGYMGEPVVGQLDVDDITAISVTGIADDQNSSHKEYSLAQNYPNPFNPSTSIKFNLPVNSFVSLNIYNAIGKEVTSLINGVEPAGAHEVLFNASGLKSGVFFYTLTAGSYIQTKKMILLK
jgi:hypothetical protein